MVAELVAELVAEFTVFHGKPRNGIYSATSATTKLKPTKYCATNCATKDKVAKVAKVA